MRAGAFCQLSLSLCFGPAPDQAATPPPLQPRPPPPRSTRRCAPDASYLAGQLTFSLSADPLAPSYLDSAATLDTPIGASLLVFGQGRCRIAPAWNVNEISFPAPGSTTTYSMPSAEVLPSQCSDSAEKLLSLSGAGGQWSWNVLQVRIPVHCPLSLVLSGSSAPWSPKLYRSKDEATSALLRSFSAHPRTPVFLAAQVLGTNQGANLIGFFATDAVQPPPPAGGSCGAGFSPMIMMEWFPQSSDNIAWSVTLLSRNLSYFDLLGTNTNILGYTTLRSIDEDVADAVNTNDPGACGALAQTASNTGCG